MSLSAGTPGTDRTASIRDDADCTEKALLECQSIVNDLLGTFPQVTGENEKQPDGSVYWLAVKCQSNRSLAANLLSRLSDLRNRI